MYVPFWRVECDGSWSVEVRPYKEFPRGAVETWHLDAISSSVRPVEVTRDPVDRETLRKLEAVEDDVLQGAAVHERSTDAL